MVIGDTLSKVRKNFALTIYVVSVLQQEMEESERQGINRMSIQAT